MKVKLKNLLFPIYNFDVCLLFHINERETLSLRVRRLGEDRIAGTKRRSERRSQTSLLNHTAEINHKDTKKKENTKPTLKS